MTQLFPIKKVFKSKILLRKKVDFQLKLIHSKTWQIHSNILARHMNSTLYCIHIDQKKKKIFVSPLFCNCSLLESDLRLSAVFTSSSS